MAVMEDGPESFMDLDEFFAFRNKLCCGVSNVENTVYDGDVSPENNLADFDEYRSNVITPSTPNEESLVDSVCDISDDPKNLPCDDNDTDNDSDEGKGGSVTSETPPDSDDTRTRGKGSRKKKSGETNSSERKAKRRRSKSTTSQTTRQDEASSDGTKNSGDGKDDKYWARRKKNNLAAKKSRDQKRQMELYIAERASNLEKENAELRSEIARLKAHLNDLNEVAEAKDKTKQMSCKME